MSSTRSIEFGIVSLQLCSLQTRKKKDIPVKKGDLFFLASFQTIIALILLVSISLRGPLCFLPCPPFFFHI